MPLGGGGGICGDRHIFTLDIFVFFVRLFIFFFFWIENERAFVKRNAHVKKFEGLLV